MKWPAGFTSTTRRRSVPGGVPIRGGFQMFAHQVVEDLMFWKNTLADPRYIKSLNYVIQKIKEAQHFHLGEFTDGEKMLGVKVTDRTLFLDPTLSKFVKLPYPTI